MKGKTHISAPWIAFYREMEAMFENDPAINIEYDEDNLKKEIILRVEDEEKAEALAQLLPKWKTFGHVTIRILVLPANELGDTRIKLFQKAFEGNPAYRYTASADGSAGFGADYVVFAKKVVQFFNDDISDAHGMKSTLYEDIARDIFEDTAGVFFCTDTED